MSAQKLSARLWQQACRARADTLHKLPATRALHTHATSTTPTTFPTSLTTTQPRSLKPHSKTPLCVTGRSRTFTSSTTLQKAILNPRQDEDGNDMEIEITPRAANRLSQLMATDSPTLTLRISVESGGCHGFQYLMSLTDMGQISQTEDTVFEGRGGAKVVMDEPSLELLKGSKVDYTMELIGSQFKVVGNPRASSSCGCGTSFDVKM